MSRIHELKTVQPFFKDLWLGRKTFEIRLDDHRGFEIGDSLILREYDPGLEMYCGPCVIAEVTSVYNLKQVFEGCNFGGQKSVDKKLVCMGIRILSRGDYDE